MTRRLDVALAADAALAIRETLVLGRHGEPPGRIRQHTTASIGGTPVLVEELPLDGSAPGLLGVHRILSSVLLLGTTTPVAPASHRHRYDLERGGQLWRRLGVEAHESDLGDAWVAATRAVG